MEKIVSISSLLEEDQRLVWKLDRLKKDVEEYKSLEIKIDIGWLKGYIERHQDMVEWHQRRAEKWRKDAVEAQNAARTYIQTYPELSKDWEDRAVECLNCAEESFKKAEEYLKEKEAAQAALSVLQNKLNLPGDELVSVETDCLIKQICEVRAKISKQLNLKV